MNNFKKLFFVLSFSFLFGLALSPTITFAQTGGCVETNYCATQINNCAFSDQCEEIIESGSLIGCKPAPACSSLDIAQCVEPACKWVAPSNLPGGLSTDVKANGGSSDPVPASNLKLDNPLGVTSVNQLIGRVINSVMGIVGSLALLMFVYGGLTWMTSSGSQEKVKKGKDILLWSAVGLIVIFGAYGLTKFIINLAT